MSKTLEKNINLNKLSTKQIIGGIEEIIVVETVDAVLIAKKDHSQFVKERSIFLNSYIRRC